MKEHTRRNRILAGSLAAIVLLFASCVGCCLVLSRGGGSRRVTRETEFQARCDGGEMRIVSEFHAVGFPDSIMSDSNGYELRFGEWIGSTSRRFELDIDPMPEHLTWSRPRTTIHGEGPLYMHVFVGRTAAAAQIERCVEANFAPILELLIEHDWAAEPGPRGRVYWRTPHASDLVPTFRNGRRTIEIARDGNIDLHDGEGNFSSVGRIVVENGQTTWSCCGEDRAVIETFRDADRRTIFDRLGEPTTSL